MLVALCVHAESVAIRFYQDIVGVGQYALQRQSACHVGRTLPVGSDGVVVYQATSLGLDTLLVYVAGHEDGSRQRDRGLPVSIYGLVVEVVSPESAAVGAVHDFRFRLCLLFGVYLILLVGA